MLRNSFFLLSIFVFRLFFLFWCFCLFAASLIWLFVSVAQFFLPSFNIFLQLFFPPSYGAATTALTLCTVLCSHNQIEFEALCRRRRRRPAVCKYIRSIAGAHHFRYGSVQRRRCAVGKRTVI